jgi:hypothetical protein
MRILLLTLSLVLVACAHPQGSTPGGTAPAPTPAVPAIDPVHDEIEAAIKPLVGKTRAEIDSSWSNQYTAVQPSQSLTLKFLWQIDATDRENCKYSVKAFCSQDTNRIYYLVFNSSGQVESYIID